VGTVCRFNRYDERCRKSTEENLRLTREGQITERFTRAIDQLGSEKLEIRLGGIYALERIAKDSPDRDYSTIMEVLTNYVRDYARRTPEGTPASTVEPHADDKTLTETENQESPKPPTGIQAILTVLWRRDKAGKAGDVELDLRATDLRGADLRRADLQKANLSEANLQKARLQGADLSEANLQGANLRGANLQGADLRVTDPNNLSQEQINEAYGDENTKLPDHLQRPTH
jgi:hypothetical protein